MPATPSATPASPLHGQCLCGTVRYAVHDAFVYALNCHCAKRRRATGSAFKPFAGIQREKLAITEGDEHLLIFGILQANHDVHCVRCGSLLFSQWSGKAAGFT